MPPRGMLPPLFRLLVPALVLAGTAVVVVARRRQQELDTSFAA